MNQLRIYNVKVVLFIQDVVPLMFKQNYDDWMKPYIEFYNQADLIILPNLKMEERLRKEGLTVKKVIYQEIWDRLMDYQPKVSKFKRELIFIGNQERFPFTKNWQYKTQLRLYARVKLADQTQKNIIYKGFLADDELIRQLDSGFGLCWSVNTPTQAEKEYSKLNASYKLSTYLAAGVPVIVNQEMPISQFIVDHGLGWAVSSLDDANSLVQNILESEYNEVAKRVNRYGEWLRKGFQSKKIYIDVIASLLDE
ncbi:nucleotide sugar synthetase-like protein [Limosilactobacillus equigenerosi DSM 18793 = JCM 14505]|uniref:Nucleotide sugar synthetase-like protein n=1 Tax=Limosilactobacillus equigenerosi DSM 18793 = JCM 14505 TaxID=1423742 RepID=A0A0R1UFW7_9LACO|nr:nucleotide sugar synthetase-like protein [Limosilactobacillus equigenerosi DSM 18793 = JCM 14505]